MHILKKRKIKLKTFLVIFTIIVSFILLSFIGSIMLDNTYEQIDENVDFTNKTKLYQTASSIDRVLMDLGNLTLYLKDSKQLINYIDTITDRDSTYIVLSSATKGLDIFLLNIASYNEVIEGINIITDKSVYFSGKTSTRFKYPPPEDVAERKVDDIVFITNKSDDYSFIREEEEIKNIDVLQNKNYYTTSLSDGNGIIGRVYIILVDNFVEAISDAAGYVVLDKYDNLISNNSSLSGEDVHKVMDLPSINDKYLYNNLPVYRHDIEFNGWKVLYIPETTEKSPLLGIMLLTMVICIIITVISAEIISSKITSPIHKLTELISSYGETRKPKKYIKKTNVYTSLRLKLFMFFIATIFIPATLFIAILYVQSTNTVKTYIEDSYHAIFEKNLDEVNEFIMTRCTALKRVAYDTYVQELLENPEDDTKCMVQDIFYSQAYLGLDRDWIGVYNGQGELLASNGNSYIGDEGEDSFYSEIETLKTGVFWNLINDRLGYKIVNLAMNIEDITQSGRAGAAYVRIEIEAKTFFETHMELLMNEGQLFITDNLGSIISQFNSEISMEAFKNADLSQTGTDGQMRLNDEEGLVFIGKLDYFDWCFISVYRNSDIEMEKSAIVKNNKFIIVLVLFFVVLLSWLVAMGIVKPIKKINRLFKNINLDNINEGMQETVFIDEISELGSTFNTMLSRIEDLFDDVMAVNAEKLKIEGEKREAEIAALQSQINPHFFYNTLDAVKYLIKSGFSKRAIGMVDNLSVLFRYGIGRDELIIGIDEEIEYARIYSDIMSLRYGNKLKFVWEIDEKAYAYRTIKLILQPVIENAINHGVKDNIDEGVIRITCTCLEKCIRFSVKDNGIGIGPEKLEEIKRNIHERKKRKRIGLHNIKTRLKLYYGEEGKLLMNSVENEGTEVIIEFPYDNFTEAIS